VIAIEDIPHLPDHQQRLEALLVDCYGPDEERAALDVYCSDALQPPFVAIWCDPDEPGYDETVTVLGIAGVDERRGVLLKVRRRSGKERAVPAEQLWAGDPGGVNAIVLDDYRQWVEGD
jgi:Calcium binding